ncbi:NUDIX domain-containing protein [Jannaschia sp. R86511]|uniref:NUDIX domain-containing protein n=1 Tax=Jannaschia sp. R86511 TaxID=3093853 RepID=UPI0036D280A1
MHGKGGLRVENPSPTPDQRTIDNIELNERPEWSSCFVFPRTDRAFFLVRTEARPDQWQPLGGHRESSDVSPIATLRREAKEEMGLEIDPSSVRYVGAHAAEEDPSDVHFWWTSVSAEMGGMPFLEEVLEGAFWSCNEARSLPMYEGSRWAVETLHSAGNCDCPSSRRS